MSTATQQETPWYFRTTTILIAGCLVAIINFGVRSTFGLFTLPISTGASSSITSPVMIGSSAAVAATALA